jgi:peptidoglycan/LPS O-acetylase OafA/YrhL
VRAFAVLAVMTYHFGVSFLGGGFLGVDTFFVLSGFLITTLLLGEWGRRAGIALGAFWARRARRLLPALLILLLGVAAYAAFAVPQDTYPGLRLDSLATLLYVANWHFILIGSNYFVQTGPVSPLTHTWSLAIEEQFYILWPLVVLFVLRHFGRRILLVVAAGGALASAVEMAILYHPASVTRLYYGTDTHAQCLLVGATLALVLAEVADARRRRGTAPTFRPGARLPGGDLAWAATSRGARAALTVAGLAGVAVTGLLWNRLSEAQAFLWRGGFLLAALATAAVLACAVCHQRSVVAWFLSLAPLRYLGRISYGMYLYHFPLFIYLDAARTGLTGWPLYFVRVAATVAVASVSFFLIERPIRQGTWARDWRAWVATPVAVVATVAAVVAATVVPAVAAGPAPGTPAATHGPPVRVLLVGDSVALTLGIGLSLDIGRRYDVDLSDQGVLGCGVVIGTNLRLQGQVVQPGFQCRTDPPPGQEQWPAYWTHRIDTFHPNVVAFLGGRWEVADWQYKGHWTNVLHPAFAAYMRRQLVRAVHVGTAQGAKLVFLTSPCFDEGEQPDGQPWPEDNPARVAAYNDLLRQVAAQYPTEVSVLDLHSMVCPGGHYQQVIDGVTVRCTDGIHFTVPPGISNTTGCYATTPGGEWLQPKVVPPMVALGRAQMAAAPTTTSTAARGP